MSEYTVNTRSKNQHHKLTPFSGAGFQLPVFVPHTSAIKTSGTENKKKVAKSDINDEFAEVATGVYCICSQRLVEQEMIISVMCMPLSGLE